MMASKQMLARSINAAVPLNIKAVVLIIHLIEGMNVLFADNFFIQKWHIEFVTIQKI